MQKSELVNAGIAEFAANNNNQFTVAAAAKHFHIHPDLAKRILVKMENAKVDKDGNVRFGQETSAKRNIKTGDAERRNKISAYFKAAAYNAELVGMTKSEFLAEVESALEKYDLVDDTEE